MQSEQEAQRHIRKVEQTISYLQSKIDDHSIPERKRDFMQQDVDAYAFLLEYAREALANRGIRV